MITIKKCFEIILSGNKEESRLAARRVRKLLHSSSMEDQEKYKQIATVIETAPENYARISENWRQANFVTAISVIYFLHDQENQPDFLFPWFFQLLQHENGNIRQAAVHMINHELGLLTYHIRFPDETSHFHRITPEQADRILANLVKSLSHLENIFWKKSYKKYKYINSLPSDPFKSIQLIFGYLDDLCAEAPPLQKTGSFVEAEAIEQILLKRKEVERDVTEMLKKIKSDLTLEEIKDFIYNTENIKDHHKLLDMFDSEINVMEWDNDMLQLIINTWNYFPHKALGGLSPEEKYLEYYGKKD